MSLSQDGHARLKLRVVRVIRECTGLHESFAAPVAESVVSTLLEEFKGERVYISESKAERDAAVMADFDGTNRKEVCAKYEIGRTTFYRIIGRRSGRKSV